MKVLFISLFVTIQLSAQTIYVIDIVNDLYRIDVNTCAVDLITPVYEIGLPDIAFHPNGNLYGISLGGSLVEVDTITGNVSLVHQFPLSIYLDNEEFYNSLTIAADGIFYTTGLHGDLYSYNLSLGNEELLGNIGYSAAGDLTFYEGELYVATGSRQIVKVDREYSQ